MNHDHNNSITNRKRKETNNTDEIVETWDEMKDEYWTIKLVEQFNFSILNDNLSALLTCYENDFVEACLNVDMNKPSHSSLKYYYDFTKHTYLATFDLDVFMYNHDFYSCVTLCLSNAGFVYPPIHRLCSRQTDTQDTSDDIEENWMLLDAVELSKFPRTLSFAHKLLKLQASEQRPECKLYYNMEERCMNLKFRNGNNFVCIQFEPSYPVHDFDDTWY